MQHVQSPGASKYACLGSNAQAPREMHDQRAVPIQASISASSERGAAELAPWFLHDNTLRRSGKFAVHRISLNRWLSPGTVLYCTTLYCATLYCTTLCCTTLYCTTLYCAVLFCALNFAQCRQWFLKAHGNSACSCGMHCRQSACGPHLVGLTELPASCSLPGGFRGCILQAHSGHMRGLCMQL
jgi:hypothetical protein